MTTGSKKHKQTSTGRKLCRDTVQQMEPAFSKRMEEKPNVDKTYDVPYIAGYSKDGKTLYVDRHLPLKVGKVDILPYLIEHEHAEKTALDLGHMDYQHAHAIATMLEHNLVNKEGEISVDDYEAHIRKYTKGIEEEKLQRLPLDLDLTPYKDEKDYDTLKRIHDAQKAEAPVRKKK